MSADELRDLAKRVMDATGPDRELDALIFMAINRSDWRDGEPSKKTNGWFKPNCASDAFSYFFHDGMGGRTTTVPLYAASLDAATTLLPDGWKLRQMNFSAPCADDRKWHLNMHGGSEGQDCFVGRGSAPALALTAAALLARAAQMEEEA